MDESAGRSVADHLRLAGHDVVSVAEIMQQADDVDVLTRASEERRILITNDKDFGDLIFRRRRIHHGVVLLRLHDESPANRVRVLSDLMARFADRLPSHFTVASESGVRIRSASS